MRYRILAVLVLFVAWFGGPALGQMLLSAEIINGRIVGERTLRVKQGEEVTLSVASDRAVALHLHGYDLERTAEPDNPAVFNFTAKATGRFSIQAIEPAAKGGKGHSHGAALLYVEVLPR
jgi:hypothetical protein